MGIAAVVFFFVSVVCFACVAVVAVVVMALVVVALVVAMLVVAAVVAGSNSGFVLTSGVVMLVWSQNFVASCLVLLFGVTNTEDDLCKTHHKNLYSFMLSFKKKKKKMCMCMYVYVRVRVYINKKRKE